MADAPNNLLDSCSSKGSRASFDGYPAVASGVIPWAADGRSIEASSAPPLRPLAARPTPGAAIRDAGEGLLSRVVAGPGLFVAVEGATALRCGAAASSAAADCASCWGTCATSPEGGACTLAFGRDGSKEAFIAGLGAPAWACMGAVHSHLAGLRAESSFCVAMTTLQYYVRTA